MTEDAQPERGKSKRKSRSVRAWADGAGSDMGIYRDGNG